MSSTSASLWTVALTAVLASASASCSSNNDGAGVDSSATGGGGGADQSGSGGSGGADIGTSGVLVDGVCTALCTAATQPVDPAEPDLGRENNAACVLPGSPTAAGQACSPVDSPPDPGNFTGMPGVVVLYTDTDTRVCEPLCVEHTDPTGDPEGDDWATERGQSCVMPGTPTGANQTCTVGEPVPPPPAESVPGVVVVDNDADTIECVPLCVINTDPEADAEGDDWSWENNASCVIPGTITGANQACMTGDPIPDPEPRDGILLLIEGETACVPLCVVTETPTDPNASDWSYENNASCVLRGTPTAEGRRECVYPDYPPDFVPPPLTGAKVAEGFYTQGGRLHDAYGQDFVIRGINNAHIWYDEYAEYQAYGALDDIASHGTNTVRVVWETTGPGSLLAEILYRIVELEMVPMVELHDVTGARDAALLSQMAEYYARDDVRQVLIDFREYLLVNIANEWSGGDVYLSAYSDAIPLLRGAGIPHTLVIDANGYGQNAQSIFDNASALLGSDPEQNLLFSVHMYTNFASATQVDAVLNQASSSAIPLIVGEFGYQLSGTDIAWEQILATSNQLGLGYLAWSWMGNDAGTAHLNLAEDWEGPLTAWGEDVFNGPGGIVQTAQPASIFQ